MWAGVIVNNPHRNHEFIEVEAYTYEYLLSKIQVKHSTAKDSRIFDSGTMATAITTIINEGKAVTSSPIASFTLGTITNPNYPWVSGTAWTFTSTYSMEFPYCNALQIISSFADITNADFTVSDSKVFTFKPTIGRDRTDISLRYGRGGNVSDYDAPLDGGNLSNDLIVFSLDKAGTNLISSSAMDTSTFGTYGRLWRSIPINDQLEQYQLNAKVGNLFKLDKSPDTQISLVLNERAMPIGTYDLGDTISIAISDGPIAVNKTARVIGWRCFVTNTGVESVSILTNL
ncbi:MAG: phage tail protein [Proteobacteria bacterium]|nr:phage tail protein [Pseudomonadota bacterium]